MAFKTFTSATLSASDVNTYLMKQVLITCTSGTRPGSPVEGMTIYETDTDKVYIYDGSNWIETLRLGGWTSYTPTVTGWAGAPTVAGKYCRVAGRTIVFQASAVCAGAMSAPSTVPTFTLPLTAAEGFLARFNASFYDASAGGFYPAVVNNTTTRADCYALAAGSTYVVQSTPSASIPFSWDTSDTLYLSGMYEAASS